MLGNVAGGEILRHHDALGAGACKRCRQERKKRRRARAMLHTGIAVGVGFRIGCLAVRVGAVIMVGLRLRGGHRIRDRAEADRDRSQSTQRHQREQRQHDEKCCSLSHRPNRSTLSKTPSLPIVSRPCAGWPSSLAVAMVRVHDSVAAAARDQPAVDREGRHRGNRQGHCQAAPEKQAVEGRIHGARND